MADTESNHVRITFWSDPFEVRDVLHKLQTQWSGWGTDEELTQKAEQVVAEVLNNVVEHAHREDPEGEIILTCVRGKSEPTLKFEIRDDGIPMPGLQLPSGKLAEFGPDTADLPEGGFGWFMIRELTQNLDYQRAGDWNVLRFTVAA
ncbi:MAG: ATP-binding protein [Pseudomonadota bacterium]